MALLKLEPSMSRQQQKNAVEAALLLGFQRETVVFPVIAPEGELAVPSKVEALAAFWHLTKAGQGVGNYVHPTGQPVQNFTAAPAVPESALDFDFREQRGLELLFAQGLFLADQDHDFLPDQLNVKFILPEPCSEACLVAACNFACRLGMETTAYKGPLVAEPGYTGNAIVFEEGLGAGMYFSEVGGHFVVHVYGAGQELKTFSAGVASSFPFLPEGRLVSELLQDMAKDLALQGSDGQLAWLDAWQNQAAEGRSSQELDCLGQGGSKPHFTLLGETDVPAYGPEVQQHFAGAELLSYKEGRQAYQKKYDLPWEVEVWQQLLAKYVYPQLRPGDQVELEGAVSEPIEVRTQVLQHVQQEIEQRGAALKSSQLVCAYKQGFSWIEEVVLPQLQKLQPEQVLIYFKPFLPAGETQWQDEDGAIPSYYNAKAKNPEQWLDLPIRYLQELYPIEDILVEKLGIAREQIRFLPYAGTEQLTYLCQATLKKQVCFTAGYQAHCAERPYLSAFPAMGKVHPATGFVLARINGRKVLEQDVPTDLEQIWQVYQDQVLPELRQYLENHFGGILTAAQQPFFQQLRLEASLSEPDYRVGCREDLLSSLDGLHEDLYFVGSDYFQQYGMERCGTIFDAPGLILPVLHARAGRPELTVTLLQQRRQAPCLLCDEKVVARPVPKQQVGVRLLASAWRQGHPELTLEVSGVPAPVVAAYAALCQQGLLKLSHAFAVSESLRFVLTDKLTSEEQKKNYLSLVGLTRDAAGRTVAQTPAELAASEQEQTVFRADFTGPGAPPPALSITEVALPEREVIGYDQYLQVLGQLRRVPGVAVTEIATSYLGRKLHALRLQTSQPGYTSLTKRLTFHPSIIINARHHANEDSSTNAVFLLLRRLLTAPEYKKLAEAVNVLLIPMENPDGAAIHYELQKEHPNWKLHVARFNGIGREFGREYFKPETIHTEALGLSKMVLRYLPDVVVDDHGVPTHEWEQQFSGYTSPAYKGFWLPRSLLYGYYWYVNNPEYQMNMALNKKMEDVIADAIAADPEITAWNKNWIWQFEKYAHAWLPKLFPADYYKNMINYWIPFQRDPEHRYASVRLPWVTTVEYTSEVADETAQGEYLYLCARAHVLHDEATLKMLLEAKCVCEAGLSFSREGWQAVYRRLRPVVV